MDYKKMVPDDFAIVFHTKEGHAIPKFPVNTDYYAWAANEAFSKTAHILPPGARVIAATFIKKACDLRGIEASTVINKLASDSVENNIYDFSNPPQVIKEIDEDEFEKILFSEDIEKTAKEVLLDKHRDKLDGKNFGLSIKTASGVDNRYPLHDSTLVKQASEFFNKHHNSLKPPHRRAFAVKLATKCRRYKLPVEDVVAKYAGSNYASDLELHIQTRKDIIEDKNSHALYDSLLEKQSHIKPQNFADILHDLDCATGVHAYWDDYIADPYYSTFEKKAGAIDKYIHDYGTGVVTGLQLGKLAEETTILAGYLSPDIVAAFERNPVMVFESLPRPQKMLIVKAIQGDLHKRTGGQYRAGEENQLDDITTGKIAAKKKEKRTWGDVGAGLVGAGTAGALAQKLAPHGAGLAVPGAMLMGYELAPMAYKKLKERIKSAAMIVDKPIDKGAIKPIMGGNKAMRKILPDGPTAMGVQNPSSRMIDKIAMEYHKYNRGSAIKKLIKNKKKQCKS